jgi:hypothetical protein
MPLIKTYRWDECDGVAGSSLGRGSCILGSITEEKVNLLQTHINFPRFLPIFPGFLERLSHLAPIY